MARLSCQTGCRSGRLPFTNTESRAWASLWKGFLGHSTRHISQSCGEKLMDVEVENWIRTSFS